MCGRVRGSEETHDLLRDVVFSGPAIRFSQTALMYPNASQTGICRPVACDLQKIIWLHNEDFCMSRCSSCWKK